MRLLYVCAIARAHLTRRRLCRATVGSVAVVAAPAVAEAPGALPPELRKYTALAPLGPADRQLGGAKRVCLSEVLPECLPDLARRRRGEDVAATPRQRCHTDGTGLYVASAPRPPRGSSTRRRRRRRGPAAVRGAASSRFADVIGRRRRRRSSPATSSAAPRARGATRSRATCRPRSSGTTAALLIPRTT